VDIEKDHRGSDRHQANNGNRTFPTLEVGGRYFAAVPSHAQQLAEELTFAESLIQATPLPNSRHMQSLIEQQKSASAPTRNDLLNSIPEQGSGV